MSASPKVILLELNELCPSLINKFIAEGHLPNFEKLKNSSDTYITDAEEELEFLEPWIQWVTLHTGATYKEHGIYRLGEADKLEQKNIWDLLSEQGKKSWICGSMNATWADQDKNVIAIPDPWSMNASASSAELQPFYDFVRSNVQEHTNESSKNKISELFDFLAFMLKNGLSIKTIGKLANTVIKTILKSDDRWKKATILDWLQFDVFRSIYKKEQPAFATYFSNSTAHFQHKFWRYMEPEKFAKKPSESEIALYKDAILYAYKNHDSLIGEALKLAGNDAQVILASALSQQPFSDLDSVGGKIFYRPHDIDNIGQQFDLSGLVAVNPVMSHQFQLVFNSESEAQSALDLLDTALHGGKKLFSAYREDEKVFCGCSFHQIIDDGVPIEFGDKKINFNDVFYLADSLKSGKHHPHGILWVQRKSAPVIKEETIPLTSAFNKIVNELS